MHTKSLNPLSVRSHPVILGIILAFAWAVPTEAKTITVTFSCDYCTPVSCPGQYCTLRQAIATAAPGDTIDFSLPAYSTISLINGELQIDKDLTITGPGGRLLTVERKFDSSVPDFRIFHVVGATVTISGLDILLGAADTGAGILNEEGRLTVANCNLELNSARISGGGIYSNLGRLTVIDSAIVNNTASFEGSNAGGGDGGGIFTYTQSDSPSDEPVKIINSTITGNVANVRGGGIFATGPNHALKLINSTVAQNDINGPTGGGIYSDGGVANVRNTIIADNSHGDFAGTLTSQGYNLISNTNDTTIVGTTTGNQLGVDPKLGSANTNGGSTYTLSLLSGSPAIDAGDSAGYNMDQRGKARPVDSPTVTNANGGDGTDIGAYEVQADQLPGCDTINNVVNNKNDSGAGSLRDVMANVCNGSTITFADNVRGAINLTSGELAINKPLTINGPGANLLSVQRSPTAGTASFRIFNIASGIDVDISGLTIAKGNLPGALDFGGGILNDGVLTLSSVNVAGNSAGIGGGISNVNGTLNLTNSTISNNSANSAGGVSGGTLNSINSTISGNAARTGNAGGITVGTASLINTTVAHNSAAGSGGGIFNNGSNGATVRARNSIIALNTAPNGPDVSGALTSDNFNLFGNASGATVTPAQFSDQIGSAAAPIDPRLGPLTNNGGGTPTHALLSGSRAIDKGHSSGWTTDQRGFSRPADRADTANAQGGDGADIGAFELPAPAPSPTPTATSTPKPTPTATPKATPTATPKGTPKTVLANISTRLKVETGDNTLIGGFIVTGTQPKKVIIRAIGPSLTIPGKLANPTLELRNSSGALLKANDDWKNSSPADKQAIIDSTIPPSNDLESAIVATLPANGAGYTAIVRGVNNTTGIGVVEMYDLDRNVDSKLANISTRGLVQTGDTVLIAGTIVLGPSSQKVIIRAIGPSLNIPGKLANPTLELRNGSGTLLAANDDWKKSPDKQAIIDSTVPPSNDLESAIVATLPGNGASYTAIVRGVNNTTGIAVVEVYALQ